MLVKAQSSDSDADRGMMPAPASLRATGQTHSVSGHGHRLLIVH
jgi:hypothetical protein